MKYLLPILALLFLSLPAEACPRARAVAGAVASRVNEVQPVRRVLRLVNEKRPGVVIPK